MACGWEAFEIYFRIKINLFKILKYLINYDRKKTIFYFFKKNLNYIKINKKLDKNNICWEFHQHALWLGQSGMDWGPNVKDEQGMIVEKTVILGTRCLRWTRNDCWELCNNPLTMGPIRDGLRPKSKMNDCSALLRFEKYSCSSTNSYRFWCGSSTWS